MGFSTRLECRIFAELGSRRVGPRRAVGQLPQLLEVSDRAVHRYHQKGSYLLRAYSRRTFLIRRLCCRPPRIDTARSAAGSSRTGLLPSILFCSDGMAYICERVTVSQVMYKTGWIRRASYLRICRPSSLSSPTFHGAVTRDRELTTERTS